LASDIVVFSDANTSMAPTAIRNLVRWFVDPGVGVVCGRLVLRDPSTGRNADGLYWKYETFLKRCEGRLGALLGSNGAIYAIRRNLYAPIPDDTIIDDFAIPLLARLRTGCRLVYDAEAIAHEQTAAAQRGEFERRARIGAGGFQAIRLLWKLLDPRRGWIACAFFSHKILRWLSPFCLLGALVASLLLCGHPLYRAALLLQVGFYAGSVIGAALLQAASPGPNPFLRVARAGQMFTSMNVALLVGFLRWLARRQTAAWAPTARLAETRAAA
jgi:cellulose synthase/poly-beta-1,6-N-acetylglucosamine synthase-like glycosyltransferase